MICNDRVMADLDLIIRGGTVIDGTGSPPRTADVAIKDGVVTEVGRVRERADREVDADGALVTPGFVDIHTHYDGQATWDSQLLPSAWHGVTTVVMGNCGVGFAPVKPEDHDRLIELMEGVEDIPGAALHEGLSWEWESFPEYLDALERRPHDIDFAAQLPHGALRLFVMGERGAARDMATPAEIAEMAAIAAEAMRAGAMGFTTSRTLNHRTSRGERTPTLTASENELVGIAMGMSEANAGVLEVVSDFLDLDHEFSIFRSMVESSGRPLSVSIAQSDRMPEQWRHILDALEDANSEGVQMRGQVAARAIGLLLGLPASMNPFMSVPAYAPLRDMPFEERVARFRDPALRDELLAAGSTYFARFDRLYRVGDPPNYEPSADDSIAAEAARRGLRPEEVAYEAMLEDGGAALLYSPFLNYTDGNLDAVAEMMRSSVTVPGLSDGGAHVGTICDASFPTFLLTHWGRDRDRGELFELPFLVKGQTRDTAETVGLLDRGLLAPGYRGDLNVIDFEHLMVRAPRMHYDLPAGGKRLLQRADGYLHTFVAGTEVYAGGEHTGALPGLLVRGAQAAPSTA
jgi:N-acyl-D-aspartate/D-glutamate deacylase